MVCAMRKGAVLSILFVVVLVAVAVIAGAQQPTKVPRIGYLTGSSDSAIAYRTEALRQGLSDLGYVEGKTLSLSGDMQTENQIASQPCRRTSTSQGRRHCYQWPNANPSR